MNADDTEQLLQDIPVQPPVVVPVRTVQEAVAAGDIPPLDMDAAEVFSQSERILQEHVRKHGNKAAEVQDLIQRVLGGDANGSNLSTSRPILTCRGTAWCGMRALNSSSTAPCVWQAPRGTEEHTRRYPWCISARLSPLS